MFACAMYPEDDPDFVAEVDAEARYQVRRLRSHPCLALWCGNNENQWLHEMRYWDHAEPPPYGALYYDHILPRAVAELDGRTPYWPGSPYGGNDHNSMRRGQPSTTGTSGTAISRAASASSRAARSQPEGVSYLPLCRGPGPLHAASSACTPRRSLETLRRVIPRISAITTARRWTGTTRTTRRTRATT